MGDKMTELKKDINIMLRKTRTLGRSLFSKGKKGNLFIFCPGTLFYCFPLKASSLEHVKNKTEQYSTPQNSLPHESADLRQMIKD